MTTGAEGWAAEVQKCSELKWICVPLATVKSMGLGGKKAYQCFSHLTSCLAQAASLVTFNLHSWSVIIISQLQCMCG